MKEEHSPPAPGESGGGPRLGGGQWSGDEDLRRFFSLSTDLFAVIRFDGRIARTNPAWERTLGYCADDLASKPCLTFIHPDDRARVREEAGRLIKGHDSAEFEIRVAHREGTYRRFLWNGTPDLERQVIYASGYDVTERRAHEVRLRELGHLIENATDYALYTLDLEGRVSTWNHAAERIVSYAESEILGRPYELFFSGEERAAGKPPELLRRALAAGRAESEDLMIRGDGATCWARCIINPVFDEQGHPTGFVVLTRDVTEMHAAVEALRESEGRYRAVAETATDAIVTIDEQSRIVYANPAAEEIFGWGQGELIGMSLTELMPEEQREPYRAGLERYIRTGRRSISWRGVALKGRRRLRGAPDAFAEVDLEVSYSESPAGGRRLFTGILRDVTEMRQVRQRMLEAQRREVVGSLMGGVAHEFNNALQIINFGVAMLRNKIAGAHPDLAKRADEILQRGEAAAEIVRQLLVFTRRDYDRAGSERRNQLDLNRLLGEELSALLRVSAGKDIELEVFPGEGLWPVRADERGIKQALINIIDNARDAMPHGGRVVMRTENVYVDAEWAAREGIERGGRYVRLSVSDTGPGMSPEVAARVFDPFFTTKEAGEGTGLGLSVVYGIVKRHGGHILVKSEPGRGTIIELYLPSDPEAGD